MRCCALPRRLRSFCTPEPGVAAGKAACVDFGTSREDRHVSHLAVPVNASPSTRRRSRGRGHICRPRDPARPGRRAESRRSPATFGIQAGIGQDCQRGADIAPAILKSLGLPDTHDHRRRYRVECRYRAGARGKADQRRRAASCRRLRFRPDHRDRAGRGTEGHSAGHQHRRGARHYRTRLQVRVPEFPDRADDSGRCLRQPEGNLRHHRRGAEDGRFHARQRHLRHRDGQGHRRGDAEIRHALHHRRGDRLRSGGARSFRRGGQGQGHQRRRAARGQPSQRRDAVDARTGQAALDAAGDPEHGAGLVRGPVHQNAGQALRRTDQLRALVRPAQEANRSA